MAPTAGSTLARRRFNPSAEYTRCSPARWFIYSEVGADPVTRHHLTHTRSNYLAKLDGESQFFCVCVCEWFLSESSISRQTRIAIRRRNPSGELTSWMVNFLTGKPRHVRVESAMSEPFRQRLARGAMYSRVLIRVWEI